MKINSMQITYDKSVDAIYIQLQDNRQVSMVARTDSFQISNILEFGTVNIDFDKDDKIAGLEILNASKHLNINFLEKVKQIG